MVVEPLMWIRLAAQRALQAATLLLGATLLAFLLMRLAPGDPFSALAANPRVRPEDVALLRDRWGLDRPLPVQYVIWLQALLQGDLGRSIRTGQPVLEVVARALGPTLELTGAAALLALGAALTLGLLAALRPHSGLDRAVTAGAYLVLSLPVFLWAFLLTLAFSVGWGVLPSAGYGEPGRPFSLGDHLRHLVLPAATLALPLAAAWSRYVRAGFLGVLARGHIRAARARGLPPAVVLLRHALPDAVTPLLGVAAVELPQVLTGAVVTETVFAWPGLGRVMQTALLGRDYPVVMGVLVFVTTLTILASLAADLLHGALDPRVRHG